MPPNRCSTRRHAAAPPEAAHAAAPADAAHAAALPRTPSRTPPPPRPTPRTPSSLRTPPHCLPVIWSTPRCKQRCRTPPAQSAARPRRRTVRPAFAPHGLPSLEDLNAGSGFKLIWNSMKGSKIHVLGSNYRSIVLEVTEGRLV